MFELGVRFSRAYKRFHDYRWQILIGIQFKDSDRERRLKSWMKYRDQLDALSEKAKSKMTTEQAIEFFKGVLG
jgi:hypothetical protein